MSGVGDDANPCSRTAPCKTFAGAISKTAAGGEINCIDPGGFGGVTITKAIAIACDQVEAGVLVAGTNGIIINAGAGDDIFLSGLDIHGVGTGIDGIRFLAGNSLHIQNSTIRRFAAANSLGVHFAPSGASELYITNTTIAENGNGATGGGIEIKPTGAAGSAKVELRSVRLQNNVNNAFRVDTTGNTGPGITVSIEDSQLVGSSNGLVVSTPAGTTSATVMLANSTVSNNSGIGILASGAAARARVGNTTITGNGTGVLFGGGANVNSYGDNRLDGNTTDGAFTAPVIPKE